MKISVVLILVGLMLLVGCAGQYQAPPAEQVASTNEGRVVFTITDAAADMGSVTSVKVTVDKVMVNSDTKGWVTVSSTPQTFDLLMLKAEGSQGLLADVQLEAGNYQQLRLDISNVLVVDDTGEHTAKLPSGELKIVGGFTVENGSTSTATFDFMVNESLHITGNGEYILAPVVQLETKENTQVEIDSDNKVAIRGGRVKTNVRVGMDVDGRVDIDVHVPKNINLTIDNTGQIKVGLGLGQGRNTQGANASAKTTVKVGVGY